MSITSSFAPLASPHGAGHSDNLASETARELTPHLSVRHTLASAFRASYIELLSPITLLTIVGAEMLLVKALTDLHPHGLGALTVSWDLAVLCNFAFYALVLGLSTLSRFALRNTYDLEVQSKGLRSRSRFALKSHLTRWRAFVWIIELDGDIWLATLGQGHFIPRESFASRTHARDFANRLRELRRSKGKNWNQIFATE